MHLLLMTAPDPVLRGTSSTQQAEARVHDAIFRSPKYYLCVIAGPLVSVAISSLRDPRFWRDVKAPCPEPCFGRN